MVMMVVGNMLTKTSVGVDGRGILMAMTSTKKSLGSTILNKARGIIKPNKKIHVGKLTDRHKIYRKGTKETFETVKLEVARLP
jgi:hypothetical protein